MDNSCVVQLYFLIFQNLVWQKTGIFCPKLYLLLFQLPFTMDCSHTHTLTYTIILRRKLFPNANICLLWKELFGEFVARCLHNLQLHDGAAATLLYEIYEAMFQVSVEYQI